MTERKPTPQATPVASAEVTEPLSAEAENGKPTVLATPVEHEFVLPAQGKDGKELRITSAGVALSKTDAKRVQDAAAAVGVILIEKDED